jgi:hypothetical protein
LAKSTRKIDINKSEKKSTSRILNFCHLLLKSCKLVPETLYYRQFPTDTTTSTDAAPVVPELFDVASCSITIDDVNEAIKSLPRKKAPGVDHLTIEMLAPLTEILTPILVYLFQLCWRWSYTLCLGE